jgi:hypothetical protein
MSAMASVLLAVQWLVATLFVVAGCLKLADRRQFVSEIADYRILPAVLVKLAATLIPGVEIAAGVLAFFTPTRTAATIVLTAFLAVFSIAVGINLLRGRTDLSCACFGRKSRRIDWFIPARNGAMFAGLVAGLVVGSDDAVPSAPAWASVLLGVVTLWVLWEARALGTPIEGDPL